MDPAEQRFLIHVQEEWKEMDHRQGGISRICDMVSIKERSFTPLLYISNTAV